MIIVSDTSPISNFFRINRLQILNKVYGNVIVPYEVYDELMALGNFGMNPSEVFSQSWIKIQPTFSAASFFNPIEKIHLGEAAAISLAKELKARYILIDDRKGHQLALKQNLYPIGTLGTLKLAKEKGVISEVKIILDELVSGANYWVSKTVYEEFLKLCNEF